MNKKLLIPVILLVIIILTGIVLYLNKNKIASGFNEKGFEFFEKKEYNKAMVYFKRAFKLNKENADV